MAYFKIHVDNFEKGDLGEDVKKGDLLYLGSDGKYYKASASDKERSTTELKIAESDGGFLDTDVKLLAYGEFTYTDFPLVPGDKYYVSYEDGKITNDLYDSEDVDYVVRYVGTAIDENKLLFNPDQTYISDNRTRVNDIPIKADFDLDDRYVSHVNSQNLPEANKSLARENIGAIPASYVKDGKLTIESSGGLVNNNIIFSANQEEDSYISLDLSEGIKSDISEGTEAFSWGDHSLEGYLKEIDLDGYATEDWVESQGYITSYEDTTYTAGEGLDLDGNEFSLTQSVLEAISKAHTHPNKDILDGIDSDDIGNWDEAYTKAHEHNNKTLLDSLEQSDLNNWNEAYDKAHTHPNKTILDGISESDVDNWDSKIDEAFADSKYALRTRTIIAGDGLEGGGNLTANRTISLSSDAKSDIQKGVEAHDYTLDDVANNGNVTTVKLVGDEEFSNTEAEDYAQMADLWKAGYSIQYLNNEYKLVLRRKDDFIISEVDLSSLVTGNLSVHIDDTDPADPELVFSQDGVEVGRIPASALLTGVVNTGELVGKQLHFKDRTGTVVINIDLSPVLDVKADKTVTISTGTGLSGGGNLSANRTVSLDTTYTDGRYSLIGHKHVWEDITDRPTSLSEFTNDLGNYGNWITKVQGDTYYAPLAHVGTGGNAHALATTSVAGFMSGADKTKLNSLSNYTHPAKTWVNKSNLTGATVISNLTIDSLGHPTNWVTRTLTPADIGAATETFVGDAIDDIEVGGRNYLLKSNEDTIPNISQTQYYLSDDIEEGTSVVVTVNVEEVTNLSNADFQLWTQRIDGVVNQKRIGDFERVKKGVFELKTSWDKFGGNFVDSVNFWSRGSESKGTNYNVINIKLEKGNKATDWTPPPEDQVTDWNETNPDSFSFLKNKPTIPTVNNGQLTLSTGTGLSGSATFTANQSGSSSFSVAVASTHKLPTTAEWNALPTTNTITRLRGTTSGTYTSGDLTLLAGANTTITQSGANITIASTNTNTTYSAGTGLSLSGTTFGQSITTSGTGTFVTGITQTTNGFQINLGTPPNTNTTYSNMTLAELNAGTVTTARSISAKTLNDWADGKYALRSRTITGTGSLTGGGDLTANRTIDLSTITKSDIAKGVEAFDRGSIETDLTTGNLTSAKTLDFDDLPIGSYAVGISSNSINSPAQVPRGLLRFGGNHVNTYNDILISTRGLHVRNSNINIWRNIWDDSNLNRLNQLEPKRGNYKSVDLASVDSNLIVVKFRKTWVGDVSNRIWINVNLSPNSTTNVETPLRLQINFKLLNGGVTSFIVEDNYNFDITLSRRAFFWEDSEYLYLKIYTMSSYCSASMNYGSIYELEYVESYIYDSAELPTDYYVAEHVTIAHRDWVNSQGFVTTDTTYSAGTLAQLNAGTNTTNRVWGAKTIADYVKQYTGDNLGLQGVTDIGNWTDNSIDFVNGSNLSFTITNGINGSPHPQAQPTVGVPSIQALNKGFLIVNSSDSFPDFSDKLPYKFGLLDNRAVWANSFSFGSDFGFRFGYLPGINGDWMSIGLDTQLHHAERLANATYTSAGGGYYNQRLHFPPENNATLATREWIEDGFMRSGRFMGVGSGQDTVGGNTATSDAIESLNISTWHSGPGRASSTNSALVSFRPYSSGSYGGQFDLYRTGDLYYRGINSGNPTSWYRIWTSKDLRSNSENDSRYARTLTNSTTNTISGTQVRRAALTGDVTAAANSNATTIANNAVTTAKIINSAVTHAKYQNIPTQRILGRGATGTGNVQELTLGTGLTLSTAGVLSASGGSSTDTLNDVVQRGNSTDKEIEISGSGNTSNSKITLGRAGYIIEFEDNGVVCGSISSQNNLTGNQYGRMMTLTNGPGSGTVHMNINEETTNLAGVNISSRMSGRDALNPIDFVTLKQARSLIPEIVDPEDEVPPPLSFVEYYRPQVIVNKRNGALYQLPSDEYGVELGEFIGITVTFIAHSSARLAGPLVLKDGSTSSEIQLDQGVSITVIANNDGWYEI